MSVPVGYINEDRLDALRAEPLRPLFERGSPEWIAIDLLHRDEITMMKCLELLREALTPNASLSGGRRRSA